MLAEAAMKKRAWALVALGMFISGVFSTVVAGLPPAGSIIGNQALATYTNAAGQTITVTSNLVQTTIKPVYAVNIESDQTKTAPGLSPVAFPHVITNIGNSADTFSLAAADLSGDSGDFTAIRVYADANRDGRPDSTSTITKTTRLAAGEQFGIVVEAVTPNSLANGNTVKLSITATSQSDGTKTKSNTDTVTISTTTALIEVTKTFSKDTANRGDTAVVTLRYQNRSGNDATLLAISDSLVTGLTLDTAQEIVWSFDSANKIDLSSNTTGSLTGTNGAKLKATHDAGNNKITFEIDKVPANTVGTVSFGVKVSSDASPGDLINVAKYRHDEDDDKSLTDETDRNSNTAVLKVIGDVSQVTIADAVAKSYKADPDGSNLDAAKLSTTDDDSTANDIVDEQGTHAQGARIPFEFVITNTGSKDGRADLVVTNNDASKFPVGTVFSLTDDKGGILTDSDGNAIPDVPVAVGTSVRVRVVAVLPKSYSRKSTDTAVTAKVSATPVGGSTANTATLKLSGAVTAATVDLVNVAGSDRLGVGSELANETNGVNPWTTVTTDPGKTVEFKLQVTPTQAGIFNLEASANGARLTDGNDDGFAADNITAFSSGVSVEFVDASGKAINNTGLLKKDESFTYTARISLPATHSPGNLDIRFRVYSPVTGVSDQKLDRITVKEKADVGIDPVVSDNSIVAGGTVEYIHVLRNNGNVDVTEGSILLSTPASGFNYVLVHDKSADGKVDSGEPTVKDIKDLGGLNVGASAQLILRVTATNAVTAGLIDIAKITIGGGLKNSAGAVTDTDSDNNIASDTTTIVSDTVKLTKKQALDATCAGGVTTFNEATLNAAPGECVVYQITAENIGVVAAKAVKIVDNTPAFTKLNTCSGSCNVSAKDAAGTAITGSNLVEPGSGKTGSLSAVVGELKPGQSGSLVYTVKVDQ